MGFVLLLVRSDQRIIGSVDFRFSELCQAGSFCMTVIARCTVTSTPVLPP